MTSEIPSTRSHQRPRPLYWVTQLVAWTFFFGLFYTINYLNDELQPGVERVILLELVTSLSISHLFRHIILRNQWLLRDIGHVLPRLSLAALLLALLATVVETSLHDLFLPHFKPLHTEPPVEHLNRVINWGLLLLIWSLGYFAYCYFIQNRREEIRNLRLETANRENQLNTLRAQLNPHFMFNALNGIRALVDEDPDQAKRAITQLSAILRNAMSTVKRRTVPLGEEIDIVKAYLALEAMRYEERLRTHFDVDPALERTPVPPMLLQTLVENAVRHGIAHLPGGGDLVVSVQRGADAVVLTVRNSGQFSPGRTPGNGIGLRNTRRRLDLIYGPMARLDIVERDGMVITEVTLPDTRNDQGTTADIGSNTPAAPYDAQPHATTP